MGFLPWHDTRVAGTVDAVQRELCVEGFLLRYQPQADGGVDGLPGAEGAFITCTFWLADALYGIGRRQQAHQLFEHLLSLRNDLGLLSEEYDLLVDGLAGIKQLDGYASQSWVVEPDYAVTLDPALTNVGMLMEPTSVVAKAWDQVDKVGARAWFQPKTVLVTGAGPIGLLAAQRGLDVHVLDRVTDGPKPDLVRDLGATYHSGDINDVAGALRPDVVIEATGADPVVFGAAANTAPYGIVCLTGVSSAGRTLSVDAGLNRDIVLENDVIIGSVNATLTHYAAAADTLAKADAGWLTVLITRRIPLERFVDAFTPQPDDVKVMITPDGSTS